MATGAPLDRTLEEWILDVEGELRQLKMDFHNFTEMRRQAAHMEANYTDRHRGGAQSTGDGRSRQERQKKPRG